MRAAIVEAGGDAVTVVKITTVELDRTVEVAIPLSLVTTRPDRVLRGTLLGTPTIMEDDWELNTVNMPSLGVVLDGAL